MPRPKKQIDELSETLETAAGHLVITDLVKPTTVLRLRQAVRRHPDIEDLLRPVETEIDELVNRCNRAHERVKEAIGLVWKDQ